MIAVNNVTDPPVFTTETPPTPSPGNLMASEEVKLFEFYFFKYIYTGLYVVDTFEFPNFRSRNRL